MDNSTVFAKTTALVSVTSIGEVQRAIQQWQINVSTAASPMPSRAPQLTMELASPSPLDLKCIPCSPSIVSAIPGGRASSVSFRRVLSLPTLHRERSSVPISEHAKATTNVCVM
jgi:hypothetical protein